MKINRFIGGLAGLVLAACGQENNTNNNNSNGNSDLDGGYSDSGYVDGGDVKVDGGQGNLPPVVIIEAKDDAGNVKNTFNVGEQVTYDLNKSYDPDCESKNKCGSSKGLHYCKAHDNLGNATNVYFPTFGRGTFNQGYGSAVSITLTVKCFDIESASLPENEKPFGEAQINIIVH